MVNETSKRERISPGSAFLLISSALFIDGAIFLASLLDYILPSVGSIIAFLSSMLAYFIFGIVFVSKRVSLMTPKTAKRFFGTALIEMIPIVNYLPGLSFFVLRTVAVVRKEDMTYNKKNGAAIAAQQQKTRQLAQARWQQRAQEMQAVEEQNQLEEEEEYQEAA